MQGVLVGTVLLLIVCIVLAAKRRKRRELKELERRRELDADADLEAVIAETIIDAPKESICRPEETRQVVTPFEAKVTASVHKFPRASNEEVSEDRRSSLNPDELFPSYAIDPVSVSLTKCCNADRHCVHQPEGPPPNYDRTWNSAAAATTYVDEARVT